MARKRDQFKVDRLARLMVYMLSHRPDEFGILPDKDGFVRLKELIQALHEEPGWGYVRASHINEVLLGKDRGQFQAIENQIRSNSRSWRLEEAVDLPKVLYTPVRRKAHPGALEKGIRAAPGHHLMLTPHREMAVRVGKRRDQRPVILEVSAAAAARTGIPFLSLGGLFLTSRIPADFIPGPPVSKELAETLRAPPPKPPTPGPDHGLPGTFLLDPDRDPDRLRKSKGRQRKGWKEAARKDRRRKRS